MKGIIAIAAFLMTVGFLSACEKLESAGVDEAIEKSADTLEANEGSASEKVDETAEKAEKKIEG